MPQPPLKVDQLQIEPGLPGVRKIDRAADGSLQFTDPVAGALKLSALASLNLNHLLIVGQGAGAQYATIQAALDAIPASASPSNPYTVLVGPGVYAENVVVEKDGVTLLGLGQAVIHVASGDALSIRQGAASTPRAVWLEALTLVADGVGTALKITGGVSSLVGQTGISLVNCSLQAPGGGTALSMTAACSLYVQGGFFFGPVAVTNWGSVYSISAFFLDALMFNYDAGGTLPFDPEGGLSFAGCRFPGGSDVTVNSQGAPGTLAFQGCFLKGGLHLLGDPSAVILGTEMGTLTLDGTAEVYREGGSRGAVVAAVGATLREPLLGGTASFADEIVKDVAFAASRPEIDYVVTVDRPDRFTVSNKSTTGFRLTSVGGAVTEDVQWIAQTGAAN